MTSQSDRMTKYFPNCGEWVISFKPTNTESARDLKPLDFSMQASSYAFELAEREATDFIAKYKPRFHDDDLFGRIEGDPSKFVVCLAQLSLATLLAQIKSHPMLPEYVIGVIEQGFIIDYVDHLPVDSTFTLICHLADIQSHCLSIERELIYGCESEVELAFAGAVNSQYECPLFEQSEFFYEVAEFAKLALRRHLDEWKRINP